VRIVTAPFVFLVAGLLWLLGRIVNAWPERWY
jgi:hypothetical protein